MPMEELPYALAFRDAIRDLIRKELDSLRPTGSLATVYSINPVAGTCTVIFPGDDASAAVPVKMQTIQPSAIGDVVQIDGESGKRYISRVVNGKAKLDAGDMALTGLLTVGSSANMFVDSAGQVSKAVSSLRYKRDIETVDITDDEVLSLRAVTYKSITEGDDKTYIGLIAEDLATGSAYPVSSRALVNFDEEGRPDSVNYDRVAVTLLPVIQRLLGTIADLTARVYALEHP